METVETGADGEMGKGEMGKGGEMVRWKYGGVGRSLLGNVYRL